MQLWELEYLVKEREKEIKRELKKCRRGRKLKKQR